MISPLSHVLVFLIYFFVGVVRIGCEVGVNSDLFKINHDLLASFSKCSVCFFSTCFL